MRGAGHPLTFQEIFDEVNRRRHITTRNPRGTLRNVLTQGGQFISLGETVYGFLPHLVAGSLLRAQLDPKGSHRGWLMYPAEVYHALWPSFFEGQKRRDRRPVHVRLPNGDKVALALEFAGAGKRGTRLPDNLNVYLTENRAARGDSLLIRIPSTQGHEGRAWLEHLRSRDENAVERRNREIADAAEAFMRSRRSLHVFVWELTVGLLGKGVYKSDVAPDPSKMCSVPTPASPRRAWSRGR